MEDKILESIAYILPAAVTGFVAYYMFNGFIHQQNSEKKLELMALKKKESLPIKLQAYERMLLFCERINPAKMLVRIKPISDNTNDYLQLIETFSAVIGRHEPFRAGVGKGSYYQSVYGQFRPRAAQPGQEIGGRSFICGPGTGLGVSCVVEGLTQGGLPYILSSEGGHHSLAPETVDQYRFLAHSDKFQGKRSYEEVLSGPGLRNVYNFFRVEDFGKDADHDISPETIVRSSTRGDPVAAAAVEFFCEALAAFCGNRCGRFRRNDHEDPEHIFLLNSISGAETAFRCVGWSAPGAGVVLRFRSERSLGNEIG